LGDDANAGTTAKPVKTMGKAFELAESASLRVYACAEEFKEGASVPRGLTLFGGLDCVKDWSYVGAATKTKVMAPAEQIAMRLLGASGGGTTEIHDVHAQAASAVMPGGSSIAMLVEGDVAAKLVQVVLEAGNGVAGAAGEPYGTGAMAGMAGVAGKVSCMVDGTGPEGPSLTCADGITFGGKGGDGGEGTGSMGGSGSPAGAVNGGAGEGGVACKSGTIGDPGLEGMAGSDAMGLGALDETGYRGTNGAPGAPGKRGQGGGGGGGASSVKVTNQCGAGSGKKGASGGSGASGGCGGAGGKGGGFGGSSIALVSLGATLSFNKVTLLAGDGGAGGEGGAGQEGGVGGISGGPGGSAPEASLTDGCAGGPGGAGGNGGKGGRGLGGHSVGLAYTGVEPPVEGVTVQKKGTPGTGGGMAADRQAFSSP
jgi:hypothetical protein